MSCCLQGPGMVWYKRTRSGKECFLFLIQNGSAYSAIREVWHSKSVTLKKASFEKSFTRKKFHSNTSEDDTALDGTAEKVWNPDDAVGDESMSKTKDRIRESNLRYKQSLGQKWKRRNLYAMNSGAENARGLFRYRIAAGGKQRCIWNDCRVWDWENCRDTFMIFR